MSRTPREQSPSNIYHVMLRGINKQQIFEEPEDYRKFLYILSDCKEISNFYLYAYCLMGNHIHLLIEPGNEPLELIFKRIGVRFVHWYNTKYQRVGHLFQDRFKSEVIPNEISFLNVFHYIHYNPIKANLTHRPFEYHWSSYFEYQNGTNDLVDTSKANKLFENRQTLLNYLNSSIPFDDENHEPSWRITDTEAKNLIYQFSNCKNVSEFQTLQKESRNLYIKKLKQCGLSLRQMERLCGISKSVVASIK